MIPLFILEEHNEAFYCWKKAIEAKYLNQTGNVLFHIDHHDDLEAGGYFHNFENKIQDLEAAKEFTYNILGIADFIVPAIYEGIFSYMFNMKALRSYPWKSQEKMVKKLGNNTLSIQNYVPFLHSQIKKNADKGYSFFTYYEGSLSELPKDLNQQGKIVLDIDLDYFCWDDSLSTTAPKRMEITEEAYLEYINNIYHPFRILPKRLLSVEKRDGRFYLCYKEPASFEKQVGYERIEKRIKNFLEWLEQVKIKPQIIDICRSAKSGYLPVDKAEFVEKNVIEGLYKIYDINIMK